MCGEFWGLTWFSGQAEGDQSLLTLLVEREELQITDYQLTANDEGGGS